MAAMNAMSEAGRVLDIKDSGETAVVAFTRTEACAKCRACAAGMTQAQMLLEAKNGVNAKKGDLVLIELPQKGFFTAAAITYLFPLSAALLGFLAGGAVSDILGFTLGVTLLAASFFAIGACERKLKSLTMFKPYITEVILDARASSEACTPLK